MVLLAPGGYALGMEQEPDKKALREQRREERQQKQEERRQERQQKQEAKEIEGRAKTVEEEKRDAEREQRRVERQQRQEERQLERASKKEEKTKVVDKKADADEKAAETQQQQDRKALREQRRAERQQKQAERKQARQQDDELRLNGVYRNSNNVMGGHNRTSAPAASPRITSYPGAERRAAQTDSEASMSTSVSSGTAGTSSKSQTSVRQGESDSGDVTGWLIAAGVIAFGILYLQWRFSGKCAHCGKYRAMVEGPADFLGTVKTEPVKDSQGKVIRIAHTNRLQIHRQCKYCGYQDVIVKDVKE